MTSLLEKINGPADLKALPADCLTDLAVEIKARITSVVGKTGGHLASSLGATELIVALHRVYDFRHDRILFDVGHQAYAHKILTGRNDRFDTLRQKDGLSGFPNPAESGTDPFKVGHASTAISQALGLACAALLTGNSARIVAVIGDGSMTGGLSYEGLNNAGHLKRNMLIVLNDNKISISPTTGALQSYLGRMRAAPLYNELRDEFTDLLKRIPLLGGTMETAAEKSLQAANRVLTPGYIFHELGFRYFGPVDGHDMAKLLSTLDDIKKLDGPVLLHVLTEKGHGYEAALKDPTSFHAAGPRNMFPEEHVDDPKEPTYTDVFSGALLKIAERNDKVVAITAACPPGTGLDAFAEEFPDRCFDVGIAESHAVTFAGALAKGGLTPVVVIYSTFLQRAYDQIFHDVALQGDLPVVIGVERAGLVGVDGPTHHGAYDIAYMRHLPGMTLCAPKDGPETVAMLEMAVELGRPIAIRYARDAAIELGLGCEPVEPGKAEKLRDGDGPAIIAYGSAVQWAMDAAGLLAKDGIEAAVWNARFAKPLDMDMVEEAYKSKLVVTVEDGCLPGGFGSAVAEAAADMNLSSRLVRMALPDSYIEHAPRGELLESLGLSGEGIAERIRKELAR